MRFALLLALLPAVGHAQALLDLVRRNDTAAAVKLISSGADARAKSPDGTTALHWAAHNDQLDLVKRLIKAGADVKVAPPDPFSPITHDVRDAAQPASKKDCLNGLMERFPPMAWAI